MSQLLTLQTNVEQAISAGQLSPDVQTWEVATLAPIYGLSVEHAETEIDDFLRQVADQVLR